MILGVSANTRLVGLAVLDSQTLLDFKTCLFKEAWSQDKRERIIGAIASAIQEHAIERIALIIPHGFHRTHEISELLTHIKAYCKKMRLPHQCYRTQALQYFAGEKRAKKKALMQELSLRYPELSFLQRRELQNRTRYYIKLFEAVGAALLARNDF